MRTTSKSYANIIKRKPGVQKTGLSNSGVYNRMAIGEFPSTIRLGKLSVGWVDLEAQNWIGARVRVSRGGAE